MSSYLHSFRTPDKLGRSLNIVGLIGFLILVLSGPLIMLPLHISQNYNEGWNAYLAERAFNQNPVLSLYPASGSMIFNNYPPLSFLIVGIFGHIIGDMVIAGRIIDLASLIASAIFVSICVKKMGKPSWPAITAGLLLLLYASTSFHRYVAINDPQWLAHALMLGGLTVLIRQHRTTSRIILAALIMVAGGFVKHNLVALPLAVTLWLALYDRRAFIVWCGAGLSGIFIGLSVSYITYGPIFFQSLFQHKRILVPFVEVMSSARKTAEISALLFASALLFIKRATDRNLRKNQIFICIFFVIALITGFLQSLGDGVNYNAQFETLILVCLATGFLLSHPEILPRKDFLKPSAILILVYAPLLVLGPIQFIHEIKNLRTLPQERIGWHNALTLVRTTPGQAACFTLALCYWAGKKEIIDFFNTTQAMLVDEKSFSLPSLLSTLDVTLIQTESQKQRAHELRLHNGHDPLNDAFKASGYRPVAFGPDDTVFLMQASGPTSSVH